MRSKILSPDRREFNTPLAFPRNEGVETRILTQLAIHEAGGNVEGAGLVGIILKKVGEKIQLTLHTATNILDDEGHQSETIEITNVEFTARIRIGRNPTTIPTPEPKPNHSQDIRVPPYFRKVSREHAVVRIGVIPEKGAYIGITLLGQHNTSVSCTSVPSTWPELFSEA